jgi:hypothetical protein
MTTAETIAALMLGLFIVLFVLDEYLIRTGRLKRKKRKSKPKGGVWKQG